MTRAIAVLRPEPGNAATAARVETAGLTAIRLPLFAVHAVDWTPPDPARFDALVLTSANAPRFAGTGLRALAHLPVHAVGAATAAAAEAAGLQVRTVGTNDGADLVEQLAAQGVSRALLLAGRERRLDTGGPITTAIAVYASDPLPISPEQVRTLTDTVALVHSARAARRLAELAPGRATIRLAAISPAVAAAAGDGWGHVAAADTPDDDTLVALASTLAD